MEKQHGSIILVANSIGAFFSLSAGIDGMISKAYFISPIVDMEKLICNMMVQAGVTEEELATKGIIRTDSGEDFSWDYLCHVRNHPIRWHVQTDILYGSRDGLINFETVHSFAEKHNATLTVMENGGHWFHSDVQMRFLDEWIRNRAVKDEDSCIEWQSQTGA